MKPNDKQGHTGKVFGEWEIYPDLSCLRNAKGEELYLEPRLMKLLHVLLQHKNEILKRDDLIQQVWEDTLVNEESLTKAVFDLRKFLKMHFAQYVEISTVRKVGYRLVLSDAAPEKSRLRSFSRMIFKAALYVFLALVFMVLVVRAINY